MLPELRDTLLLTVAHPGLARREPEMRGYPVTTAFQRCTFSCLVDSRASRREKKELKYSRRDKNEGTNLRWRSVKRARYVDPVSESLQGGRDKRRVEDNGWGETDTKM